MSVLHVLEPYCLPVALPALLVGLAALIGVRLKHRTDCELQAARNDQATRCAHGNRKWKCSACARAWADEVERERAPRDAGAGGGGGSCGDLTFMGFGDPHMGRGVDVLPELNWQSGEVQVAAVSTEIVPPDKRRRSLIITNNGACDVYLSTGMKPASMGLGLHLHPGGWLQLGQMDDCTSRWNAIAYSMAPLSLRWASESDEIEGALVLDVPPYQGGARFTLEFDTNASCPGGVVNVAHQYADGSIANAGLVNVPSAVANRSWLDSARGQIKRLIFDEIKGMEHVRVLVDGMILMDVNTRQLRELMRYQRSRKC